MSLIRSVSRPQRRATARRRRGHNEQSYFLFSFANEFEFGAARRETVGERDGGREREREREERDREEEERGGGEKRRREEEQRARQAEERLLCLINNLHASQKASIRATRKHERRGNSIIPWTHAVLF